MLNIIERLCFEIEKDCFLRVRRVFKYEDLIEGFMGLQTLRNT